MEFSLLIDRILAIRVMNVIRVIKSYVVNNVLIPILILSCSLSRDCTEHQIRVMIISKIVLRELDLKAVLVFLILGINVFKPD